MITRQGMLNPQLVFTINFECIKKEGNRAKKKEKKR